LSNKQHRNRNFQNFIKSNKFGQHTWTTLFTYRMNCKIVIKTIELYSNLLQQKLSTTKHSSVDILRIKQQLYLDTISKISILIESFLVLIDSLSHSYGLVSKNMLGYNLGKIHSIIKNIHANPVEYDMRLVLGLYDISRMSFLSEHQKIVLEKVYDETQKIAISKLKNLAEFYDDFYIVYVKTKHGLTYYSGQVPKSSHDNGFLDSLLICMYKKNFGLICFLYENAFSIMLRPLTVFW
jgi:hypothetical protein